MRRTWPRHAGATSRRQPLLRRKGLLQAMQNQGGIASMDEDVQAESPAAEEDFAAVLFLSLAGLDLSLWLLGKGNLGDCLMVLAL